MQCEREEKYNNNNNNNNNAYQKPAQAKEISLTQIYDEDDDKSEVNLGIK